MEEDLGSDMNGNINLVVLEKEKEGVRIVLFAYLLTILYSTIFSSPPYVLLFFGTLLI